MMYNTGIVSSAHYNILEVIYPQVPLRIPCYDLALLIKLWFETINFSMAPHQNLTWVT